MLIIHRAFARLPSRNNFLPFSILLFPKIPCPLFLPFSASSLPLHLYYPLNNSLCVESDFRCLPPTLHHPAQAGASEDQVHGSACFPPVPYPSLCSFSAVPSAVKRFRCLLFSVTLCRITVLPRLICRQQTCAACVHVFLGLYVHDRCPRRVVRHADAHSFLLRRRSNITAFIWSSPNHRCDNMKQHMDAVFP